MHKDSFDSCRHFYDKINNRDLIITSSFDEHVKVINFQKKDTEIIIDLNLESRVIQIINTACLLNNKIVVPFSHIENGIIELILNVSKGFYIRSFSNDLAMKLNTVGSVQELCRLKQSK